MLVEVLKGEQLFKNVPGRQHRSFPAIEFDVITQLNANKLNSWLTGKKEEYATGQRRRSYNVQSVILTSAICDKIFICIHLY
jgi:hypothetical protein